MKWIRILEPVLIIVSPFALVGLIVVFGGSLYLWILAPQRLAFQRPSTKQWGDILEPHRTVMEPQPLRVSPSDSNVLMLFPGLEDISNTNTAVWVNGKPFNSGAAAAWELSRSGWFVYLIGILSLAMMWQVRRKRAGSK